MMKYQAAVVATLTRLIAIVDNENRDARDRLAAKAQTEAPEALQGILDAIAKSEGARTLYRRTLGGIEANGAVTFNQVKLWHEDLNGSPWRSDAYREGLDVARRNLSDWIE